MTVKLKDVKITYNLIDAEQIGSKQLFTGYSTIYKRWLYISYNTIIAVKYDGCWYIDTTKYSRTTSTHQNEIRKLEGKCLSTSSIRAYLGE